MAYHPQDKYIRRGNFRAPRSALARARTAAAARRRRTPSTTRPTRTTPSDSRPSIPERTYAALYNSFRALHT